MSESAKSLSDKQVLETKKTELDMMKSSVLSREEIIIMRKAILGDSDSKALLQKSEDDIVTKQKEINDLEV